MPLFSRMIKMKKYIVALLSCFLVACNSSDDSDPSTQPITPLNLNDIDLTGMWVLNTHEDKIRSDNGDTASTSYRRQTYIFSDTPYGVEYNECAEYHIPSETKTGAKTNNYFYFHINNIDEVGFSANSQNQLKREYSYTSEFDLEAGFTFNLEQSLIRVNEHPALDQGNFILNGPITIAEYDHACLYEHYELTGNEYQVILAMPFDNYTINISIFFKGTIESGTFRYNNYFDAHEVSIDITSDANAFEEIVGSNTLSPEDVTINITEVTNSKIIGNFSFTGQDQGEYSGEFAIDNNGQDTLNNKIINSLQ